MKTQQEKAQRFVDLHAGSKCFLIPNPWDTGSARLLEHMGFEALASTSAGFAFSHGQPDMSVSREEKMLHLRELCAATNLPVNADLENGYGHKPEDAAETIRQAALAGVVGGSIEDSTGDVSHPIYEIGAAADRIRAAAEAARATGFKFMLVGRAENHLWGRNDLPDTIRRLQAYQEAGADVLFAPGVKTLEDIRTVLASIDRPFNVILGSVPLTVAQLQEAGVRRLSTGGSLARVAYGSMMRAAREMLESGAFDFARDMPPHKFFNDVFKA